MAAASLSWRDQPPPGFTGGAVTVGNFDGVHCGHRVLVAAARNWAEKIEGPVVAVTFDPHPFQILNPATPPRPPLTTFADRVELLHSAGADHVVILRTEPELLALTPEEFFREILARQLEAKAVVEGFNFRFGCGRAGTTATLHDLCAVAGMGFEEVPPLMMGEEPVSSSRVRAALVASEVATAVDLLGRPYRIAGVVIKGAKRGRTIGFPTANLGDVPTVLPGNGVYAVRAMVDGQSWPAAANIGPNPTFGEAARKIEIHLIGYAGDVYGKSMAVDFIQKLRDTRPFASAADLIEQLKADVEVAQQWT
jgi:riboflavin kinase/FMN adenylyltransferase